MVGAAASSQGIDTADIGIQLGLNRGFIKVKGDDRRCAPWQVSISERKTWK